MSPSDSSAGLTAHAVRERLADFSRVSKSLSREEEDELPRLVEALKWHLKDRCVRLVQSAQHAAVLWSYGSDSTKLRVAATQDETSGDHRHVRQGRQTEHFLMQRGLMKVQYADGTQELGFLWSDIVSLSAGQKGWNMFSAAAQFFPVLRRLGHSGICLQHYCFDRGVYECMNRHLRERQEAFYHADLNPSLDRDSAHLLHLTDWSLSSGCCVHDVHNAQKWALRAAGPKETIDDLHIIIESLRNTFPSLLIALPRFLVAHVSFHRECRDPDLVTEFWSAIGVGKMISMIVDLILGGMVSIF